MLFHTELNIYSVQCVLAHPNNASFLTKGAIFIILLNPKQGVND